MRERLLDFGLLLLRVGVGLGLMLHGWSKLQGGVESWAAKSVEPLGFPVPLLFAWLAVATEVVGGFLLILGLWTRYAAAAVVIMMSVAAFGRHAADPWVAPGQSPTKELALAYLVIAAALALTGAGRYAVDANRGGGRPAPRKKAKA